MAKFVGEIGFSLDPSEVPDSGIVVPEITEIKYHGDIMNATYKWNDNSKINEDLNISNKFSVVANSFAIENIGHMLYVKWNGVKWKIITAELVFPRITLYVGGLYNA